VRGALKYISSPRQAKWSPRLPAGREFTTYRCFRPQGRLRNNIRRIYRLFCEKPRQFIHSQIITATIERPSRASPGTLSLFSLIPRIASSQLPAACIAKSNVVLAQCEVARCLPVDTGSRAAGEGAKAHSPSELGRTASIGATGQDRIASFRGGHSDVGLGRSHRDSAMGH
jgi:hypothetical protein